MYPKYFIFRVHLSISANLCLRSVKSTEDKTRLNLYLYFTVHGTEVGSFTLCSLENKCGCVYPCGWNEHMVLDQIGSYLCSISKITFLYTSKSASLVKFRLYLEQFNATSAGNLIKKSLLLSGCLKLSLSFSLPLYYLSQSSTIIQKLKKVREKGKGALVCSPDLVVKVTTNLSGCSKVHGQAGILFLLV